MTRGRGASELHLSQAQIETLLLATQTDGWARTYRAAGLQETTFRHALEGAGLQRRTFEALRDYAEQWRASHCNHEGIGEPECRTCDPRGAA